MVRIFAQVTTFIIISGLKIINTKKITVIGVSTYAKHSQYVSTATNFCAGIILSRGVWLNIPRTKYHLYTCAILRPAITVKWSSESHMSWLFGFIKGPKSALSISWIIIKPFQRFSWSFICDADVVEVYQRPSVIPCSGSYRNCQSYSSCMFLY